MTNAEKQDYGWDIAENRNYVGRREYLTLGDLAIKIPQVVDRLGYDQRVQSDIKAALTTRVNSLRVGAAPEGPPGSHPPPRPAEARCQGPARTGRQHDVIGVHHGFHQVT